MTKQERDSRLDELNDLAKWAHERKESGVTWHDIACYITDRVKLLADEDWWKQHE